jgi:hypothetical protein
MQFFFEKYLHYFLRTVFSSKMTTLSVMAGNSVGALGLRCAALLFDPGEARFARFSAY